MSERGPMDWADKMADELAACRETVKRLNRRCQLAEAAVKEKVEAGDPSRRTLGRILANGAAEMYRNELATFRSEVEAVRDEMQRTQGGHNFLTGEGPRAVADSDVIRWMLRLDKALGVEIPKEEP